MPESIDHLTQLEYLDIGNNQFEDLPKSLVNPPQIKFLDISDDELKNFTKDSDKFNGQEDYLTQAEMDFLATEIKKRGNKL